MSMDFRTAADDVVQSSAALTKGIPDAMAGFAGLGKGAYADKVLSRKFKELIALALGVAARCDGCVAYHARKVADLGATREEVAGSARGLRADGRRSLDGLWRRGAQGLRFLRGREAGEVSRLTLPRAGPHPSAFASPGLPSGRESL